MNGAVNASELNIMGLNIDPPCKEPSWMAGTLMVRGNPHECLTRMQSKGMQLYVKWE
jgi:hypothetical protein